MRVIGYVEREVNGLTLKYALKESEHAMGITIIKEYRIYAIDSGIVDELIAVFYDEMNAKRYFLALEEGNV